MVVVPLTEAHGYVLRKIVLVKGNNRVAWTQKYLRQIEITC